MLLRVIESFDCFPFCGLYSLLRILFYFHFPHSYKCQSFLRLRCRSYHIAEHGKHFVSDLSASGGLQSVPGHPTKPHSYLPRSCDRWKLQSRWTAAPGIHWPGASRRWRRKSWTRERTSGWAPPQTPGRDRGVRRGWSRPVPPSPLGVSPHTGWPLLRLLWKRGMLGMVQYHVLVKLGCNQTWGSVKTRRELGHHIEVTTERQVLKTLAYIMDRYGTKPYAIKL